MHIMECLLSKLDPKDPILTEFHVIKKIKIKNKNKNNYDMKVF